jgi:hypothetical protein
MADDYTDNISTSGRLSPGGQASGVLDASNDSDWFRIALAANTFYTFELSAPPQTGYYRSLFFYGSKGEAISSSSYTYSAPLSFTVKSSTAGNYYIAVRDFPSSSTNFTAQPYTVKASAGIVDDIGDTRDAAKQIVVGQKTSALLEASSDVDYFKVSLQAGITYKIMPTWNPNSANTAYGYIRVEDPDGNNVSGASSPSFTATRSGDYYFSVSNWGGSVTNYDVTVSKAVDDHAANSSGAGHLTIGAAATTGLLEVEGDRDWYGVQLNAATTYWFTLGTGSGSPAYNGGGATLKLLAEDGTVVATNSDYLGSQGAMVLQYVPTTGGKYHLEVSNNSSGTGAYQVRAVVGEKDDYGNTASAAADIAVGSAVQGKLAIPQDMDVFKLSVTAGKTYLVSLTAQALASGNKLNMNGSSADYYIGASLAEYRKTGMEQYRVLTADKSGDYYFTVSNSNTSGTHASSYTLTVTEPPNDDFAADRSTTGALNVGGSVTGKLDYTGDIDTFKITLQYGAKYVFQLRGAGSGEGSLALGNMALQITSAAQSGSGSLVNSRDGNYTFTSDGAGDYYVSVRPVSSYLSANADDLTGSYALHATAISGDTTGPAVASYTATNVAPFDNITVRFNETIMRGAGNYGEIITLRDSVGATLESYYRDDSNITILGDTLTINPTMKLKPGTQYLLSMPAGVVVDLAGNKAAGNQLLTIDTLRTVTAGGDGNDYLVGLGIGAKLSGGSGLDTVIYGSYRSAYDVGRTASGAAVSEKYSSSKNPDILDGVERLMFSDTSVALDIDGAAGQAYRLYQAAFNRAPDSTGIGFWMKQMDNGMRLVDVARDFVNSDEFVKLYGPAPGNSAFLTNLYQNALHRAPDQTGFDFWMDSLAHGTDRAVVLKDFSESPENYATALKVIGNGFEYTPYS